MSQSPSKAADALCPFPRNGLGSSLGTFPVLCVLLFLATALTGIGLYDLPDVSIEGVSLLTLISGAAIAIQVVYLWRITRSARAMVPILILVGGFFSLYVSSPVPAAMLCGTVFVMGAGSTAVAVLPKEKLVCLPFLPLAAYALTALLSRDPLGALLVLIPWPAAVVLALSTRRSAEQEDGPNRVGVICAVSATMGLTLVAYGALALFRVLGTLEPAALDKALETVREGIVQSFLSYEIPEGVDPELVDKWNSIMTYANLREMVNSGFNLLPGVAVAAILMLVAACQSVQHAALRTFGYEDSITNHVKEFRMSLVACIVFLVAYLLVFLENSTISSLVGTVAQNVTIILLPGLALAGMLRAIRALTKKGAKGMGCLFFFIILIPCLLIVAPLVLAAVEVVGNISSVVAKLLNPPDDDDPFSKLNK